MDTDARRLRAGWLTDIHLNFLQPEERAAFYKGLSERNLDALLVGGDIGEADSVVQFLGEMERAVEAPIYFVLGNHDFYGGSIAAVRAAISRLCAGSRRLHWLTASGVIPLTADTALIGHDSWADGRLGDFFRSEVMLNDYVLIQELRGLKKGQRFAKLRELGDEAAEFLATRVREALAWKNIVVLTHVPPFREACWHEGQISNDDYLPHFACRAVGERLAVVMRDHPGNSMTILCGHTHSPGSVRVLENLEVLTGGAQYGEPALQRILDLNSTV
jgi:3',5'-cyclic AMP phosphodiesterase CpdA